ncbi:MAG: adenosylmethionine--8-amino-7-oxononanoate transaminase [Hyphomicrobiaceae bacterium]
MTDFLDLDRRHVWHPYTQHATEAPAIAIARASGASLFTPEGREILDLISSWWTTTHGHAHAGLNAALAEQAGKVEHVMFAGFTHEPAARLAAALAERLGHGLTRVFFSDNGSTAVEVALKLAFQHWHNKGERRHRFIAFDGGYHGDTFGAMAVGRGSGFFGAYQDLLLEVETVPFPATWDGDTEVAAREAEALERIEKRLIAADGAVAAIIVEPLMQGAGGMRFCRPAFMSALVDLAHRLDTLVIFDEVATGFGRTGTLFAFEQARAPDIICLSKGLTAGYLPLAVTVTTERIFETFLGDSFARALVHGHSFTANPLAAAVALRSLALFGEEGTLPRIAAIEDRHRQAMARLAVHPRATRPRVLGSVLAFDLAGGAGDYKSAESVALRDHFLTMGLNIRPLGGTVYLMPPYCITDDQLERAYDGLIRGLDALGKA